jgi:GrpB-like predicted nucleotidyltransferase (UPF0157 family)
LAGRFGRGTAESPDERVARLLAEPAYVVPYDPTWPEAFRREQARLRSCLPAEVVGRIEHFGSTAVPGLSAKPVVDILVEVTDLAAVRERVVPILEAQGYEYVWRPTTGDDGGPWYAWFIKRHPTSGARTHHIHMVEPTFLDHWDRLLVRDYLIAHPEEARSYGALKARLVADGGGDRLKYATGKREYLDRLTRLARHWRSEQAELQAFFDGWPASRVVFDAVLSVVRSLDGGDDVTLAVGKSQVAFRRRRAFAWAWVPGRYLRGERPPLVLSVALRHRDPSPRWKQIVEPAPGRFVHHVELLAAQDVDDEVRDWLRHAAGGA